jgi:hypothetical protein
MILEAAVTYLWISARCLMPCAKSNVLSGVVKLGGAIREMRMPRPAFLIGLAVASRARVKTNRETFKSQNILWTP